MSKLEELITATEKKIDTIKEHRQKQDIPEYGTQKKIELLLIELQIERLMGQVKDLCDKWQKKIQDE